MIQFTKVLQQNKPCFQYLNVINPEISDAKIKEVVRLVNFQIIRFEATMDELKQAVWHALKDKCMERISGKKPKRSVKLHNGEPDQMLQKS